MTSESQHTIEYTDSELKHFHFRYFAQLITYQILTALQIVLIISTIINFHRSSKQRSFTASERLTNNRLKWTFISVLSLGSLIFALVEWYGIADFLYDFAALYKYCDIAGILGNLSLMTYLLALYIFYLYRLYATFRNSAMQLSKCTLKTLLIITFGTYLVLIILVFILQKGAVEHRPFAWSMKKSDYKWITICEGEFSIGIHSGLRWALQAVVIVGNAFYGCIFYKKLYDLLKFLKEQQNDKNIHGIVKLMNKQATLIMVSTVSTSILWSLTNVLHYFGSFLQVLIYLDISINCFCLFLMFKWNDALYIKLCKPCAVCNEYCCRLLLRTEILNQLEQSTGKGTQSSPVDVEITPGGYQYQLHFHRYEGSKGKSSKESVSANVAV